MRRTGFLATVVLLGATLVGCAESSNTSSSGSEPLVQTTPGSSVSPGPGQNEELVIYSGRQERLVGPIIDAFSRETGIKVSVRYGDTAQLAAQLIEEGTRTDADVFFSQDGGALGALDKRDRLSPIPQETLDRVPAQFRAGDGKWIGTSARSRVIVYDPKQLTEDQVPNSVLDLTDPKWKGQIGIAPNNASFQSFVTAMRVLKGEEGAKSWLEGIKANEPKIYDNNILILNAAERSQIKVGLINHYYWYEQVAEEGIEKVPARLKFLPNGDPGALINVAGAAVLNGTNAPNAAQRFISYLVSENAQREFSLKLKEYPLLANVPLPPDLPALNTLQAPAINLADLDTLDQTLALLEDVGIT
ncbi:MAG: iron ABC transporter substrate-binding protein [Sporichthyaceae bacterium]|jgi:iron(III) transport system substrate-binding protein